MGKKSIAVVLVGTTLMLGACQTNDQTATVMGGAGIGTALGAGLGAVVGGRDGAIIGGLIGAGIGAAIGDEIAGRKAKYASTEEMIEKETILTQQNTKAIQGYNKQIKAQIVALNKEIAKQKRDQAKGKVILASTDELQSRTQREVDEANKRLAMVDKELETTTKELAEAAKEKPGRTGGWEKGLADLKRKRDELKRSVDDLTARSRAIGTGSR